MSLPHRDLWWPRKFETFERALCWPFPICRRGQTAAVVPGLSASKFPFVPTEGVGPQNPCIHQVLPSELRSLLVAGMSSTALAAERLSGHSAAAPGSCCDTKIVVSSSVPGLSAHTSVYFYFCPVISCKLNNSQSDAIICK